MGKRRPQLLLLVAALAAYAYFYQAGGWNQNSRFDLVRALVEDGTTRIDRFHANTGDKSCRGPRGRCIKAGDGDHYYCDKAPGVSLLAVPVHAAIFAASGSPPQPGEGALAGQAHAATVVAVAIPCALAVAALFGLLAALGHSPRRSAIGAAGYGLCTLAFPYATLLYGHAVAGALLAIGFALLVGARPDGAPSWQRLVAVGLALGGAVVVEYPAALAALPIGIYAASWLRPARRLGWIAAGMAVPAIVCAIYHQAAFGSPLALPYDFSTQPHRSQGFFMGLGMPQPEALAGILVSSYRGLWWSCPWLLAAIPGAVAMVRAGRWRREAAVCIAVVVLFVWLNASLVDWQGGWAMGPRYLIPSLPFWVILAVAALDLVPPGTGRRAAVALALAALLYSGATMFAGTAVRPEVPVNVRAPLGGYIWPRWWKGELAVNNQSIDRAAGSGPPRAYNLGQRLGLRRGWSVVPLGLVLAAVAVVLARVTARRR